MNVPTKPNSPGKPCRSDCPSGDCANCIGLFNKPQTTCESMRDIATAAKCASSCDGVCNTAEIGCLRGLPEWQRHVERKLQASSATQLQSSGVEEIEDAKEIGDSHCTRCAVGQGRVCECRSKPMSLDRFAPRIVLGGLALFWGLAIGAALLRGCAA